jgi:hypothetical protein
MTPLVPELAALSLVGRYNDSSDDGGPIGGQLNGYAGEPSQPLTRADVDKASDEDA